MASDRIGKPTVRVIDHTFDKPEYNLALDQVLLDQAEEGISGAVLRFWEPAQPFVVLGVSQKLSEEVREDACDRDGIPIHRRCSAGGCVLQAPGCLNYAFILDTVERPEVSTIRSSYEVILGRICAAFNAVPLRVNREGISDLAIDGKKVAGSAQRRRKRFILHHGALLFGLDFALLDRYLKEPREQPSYRGRRPHGAFVQNLAQTPGQLKDIIRTSQRAYNETDTLLDREIEKTARLAKERYCGVQWIRRR